jgi:hypothetical protein
VNSASGGAEQIVVNIIGIDGGWRSECRAIGDCRMNVWCHWWTCGVDLVRLYDSECRSTSNKWKENTDDWNSIQCNSVFL